MSKRSVPEADSPPPLPRRHRLPVGLPVRPQAYPRRPGYFLRILI